MPATIKSDFDISDDFDTPQRAAGAESACVYFGPERLARVKARAKAKGQKLSVYVCLAVDAAVEIDAARMDKLNALAKLKGIPPLDVLAQLIDKAAAAV